MNYRTLFLYLIIFVSSARIAYGMQEQGQMRLKQEANNVKNELLAARLTRELSAIEQQQLDRLVNIETMIAGFAQLTTQQQPLRTRRGNNRFVNTTPEKPARLQKTEDGSQNK